MRDDGRVDTIHALRTAYRARSLSPVAVVSDALARAHAAAATVNPFVTLCEASALEQAHALAGRFARGEDPGPLAGIPVTVKDNIPTRGLRTTFGSPAFAEHVPGHDALAVRRLRAAGAVIIGKTTTPAFACRQTTNSALFGITRNPLDPALTPGGSSGGSSASLALGIGLLSLVTDGGGSSRLPAACTGVVGFKATRGRIPFDLGADAFGTIAQMGVMGRCVADVRGGLAVLAGYDAADPNSCLPPLPYPSDGRGLVNPASPLAGVRFGWRARLDAEAVDPALLTVLERALRQLAGCGAEVVALEGGLESASEPWRILQSTQWAARFAGQAALLATLDPVIADGIDYACGLGATHLQAASNARTRLYHAVNQWLGGCDVIATPTLARGPLPAEHDGRGVIEVAGAPAGDIREAWAPFLGLFTMTGHPAISLNAGFTACGLPVGLHLVAGWGQDMRLLRIAEAVESVLCLPPRLHPR